MSAPTAGKPAGASGAPAVAGSRAPASAGASGHGGEAGTSSEPEDDAGVAADSGASGSAGAAAGASGSAGSTAGAGGTGGVTMPIDYGKPGPYKVSIEKNVGASFRNRGVYDDSAQCNLFIAGASAGDPNADPDVLEQLTSYPADMDRGLYTLFRPETLEEGKKYPVLTWGNGTCSQPLLFEELLTHVASHGFIIIASNWRWVASGEEMLHGIDFILSENQSQSSALFGKIDSKALGAFGHSQGSMATVVVGADARIVTTVPIMGANASDVARLKGPAFFIAGEKDMIVDPNGVEQAFRTATVPAVFGLAMGKDHLMPGLDPSPILKAVTAWLKIQLTGDQSVRDLFYGTSCGLCSDPTWRIEQRNF